MPMSRRASGVSERSMARRLVWEEWNSVLYCLATRTQFDNVLAFILHNGIIQMSPVIVALVARYWSVTVMNVATCIVIRRVGE
jgi:hypothetical protein